MANKKSESYLTGAAILAATIVITKIIGAIYKIPVYNLLGDEGTSHFQATYLVYSLLLSISTAGIPVALSRLIAAARATGRYKQINEYFRLSMISFSLIGIVCMVLMLIFPQQLADLIGNSEIKLGIVFLAPAVFFSCIISVYRGYSQGFSDMLPTSLSQIVEVVGKLVFGIIFTFILAKMGKDSATVSAGAIVGVTIGLGLCVPLLMFYKKRVDKSVIHKTQLDPCLSSAETLKLIFKISIPMALSSSLMNIFSFVDTKLIYTRLQQGAMMSVQQSNILYGVYGKAQTLFNIPSAFIVPITVSVVPAISAALANKDRIGARDTMESSLKVTTLFALPAGVGLCVLSYPIFNVLYPGSNQSGPALLAVLGIASYFVCLQLVTNSFLQATGYEKLALLSLPLGGVLKIIANWFLIGSSDINIMGAPFATLLCYVFITVFNFAVIKKCLKNPPRILRTVLKPTVCTAVMAVAAVLSYKLFADVLGLASGRLGLAVSMCLAILIAVVVYGAAILLTGTITKEDMQFVPKGEKIAKILKLK